MKTNIFIRRTTVLAVLIVISLVVQAPGHFGLRDDSALAESSPEQAVATTVPATEIAAGICPANGLYASAQVAASDTAGGATLPTAALDGSHVITASDMQEEANTPQAIGTRHAGPGVRIASLAGNGAAQHAFSNASASRAFSGLQESGRSRAGGAQSAGAGAGSSASSAPLARNPQQQSPQPQQQTAALGNPESDPIAPARQDKQARPAPAGNEDGRGVELAGLSPNPFLNGNNGNSGSGSGVDGGTNSTKDAGPIDPGAQGKTPSQGADIHPAIAVIAAAKTGENAGLAPVSDGSGPPDMKDLIIAPDWTLPPAAHGKDAGTFAPAGCQSTGTCAAPVSAASNAVPEPDSLALVGVGLLGLWLGRRRKATAPMAPSVRASHAFKQSRYSS